MKNKNHCACVKSVLQLPLKNFRTDIMHVKPVKSRLTGRKQTLQMIFVLFFSFFNLISLCGLSSSDTGVGNIIYPYNATTAIVKTGESFEVWFDSKPDQVVKSVVLNGPYNKASIPSESINRISGSWEYDPVSGNTYNTKINVKVPQDLPEDRYDLILKTSNGEVISRSAVKVIKEYKTKYKIYLISDSHFGQRKTEVMVPNKHTAFVEMANIINADIVVNAGDVVSYHSDPSQLQERMDLFYHGNKATGLQGMQDFNAATFVVAGNHDFQEGGGIDGLPLRGHYDLKSDYWNRWHGLQYHFFKYGNSRSEKGC